MTESTVVGTLEFMSPINRDNGYRNENLSPNTKSVMTMYKMDYGYMIEWEIEELDEVEHINLYVFYDDGQGNVIAGDSRGSVMDYDGVFELPEQIKDWLVRLHISFDTELFDEELA